ncbi:MAG: UDP-N-acetylmuramoyl-tripeptide--D-alanyl-D-alanine ligase [Patescibacteria group bacterium]|jgi:UDP-N-acetylmuramoyl-tripeptide--D-alanyl-D-alanine ligase|nr:UDP-N-acetylmuramoyl-tripeptide--D-alanyl-D-alanine ligase [Patescibacteria group bacterium]
MKKIFKKVLEIKLRYLAKVILDKYQPQIIAITGSVGKTSTKEAVYQVLSASTRKVRANAKNYNNEIGIPLSIIGSESGGRSLFRWLSVFFKAWRLIFFQDQSYPEILILEMGADRPGDLQYLINFVPLKVAVVTSVAEVHLEFFKTINEIAKEKSSLVRALAKDGLAILNYDDKLVKEMTKLAKGKVVTFGLQPQADLSASEISVSHNVDYKDVSTIQGISFKLKYNGKTVPVLLPKVLGQHLVYSVLAAIAVGMAYEMNLHDIIEAIKKFEPPRGRMNIIEGIKNTLIIDDSYNASPLSVGKALNQLSLINLNDFHRKFAVLGDMLELGSRTEMAHQEIGQAAAGYGIDYLITVGEMSRDIVRGALGAGMSEDQCFNFKDSVEAGKFLQQKLKSGDLVLVKGSQGVRMEKVVKEVMAHPELAPELLVRQDKSWAAK